MLAGPVKGSWARFMLHMPYDEPALFEYLLDQAWSGNTASMADVCSYFRTHEDYYLLMESMLWSETESDE